MSARPVVSSRPPWWIGAALLAAVALVVLYRGTGWGTTTEPSAREARSGDGGTAATAGDDSALSEAIAARRSDVWVEFDAQVTKSLPDDDESPRHQRFLVRTDAGESILVAHNLDVSDRVPVKPGERVRLKGRYEWNDKGGVLHWTHRDSTKGAPRGWIEAGGRRYE